MYTSTSILYYIYTQVEEATESKGGGTLQNWSDFLLQKLHFYGETLNLRGALAPLAPYFRCLCIYIYYYVPISIQFYIFVCVFYTLQELWWNILLSLFRQKSPVTQLSKTSQSVWQLASCVGHIIKVAHIPSCATLPQHINHFTIPVKHTHTVV